MPYKPNKIVNNIEFSELELNLLAKIENSVRDEQYVHPKHFRTELFDRLWRRVDDLVDGGNKEAVKLSKALRKIFHLNGIVRADAGEILPILESFSEGKNA